MRERGGSGGSHGGAHYKRNMGTIREPNWTIGQRINRAGKRAEAAAQKVGIGGSTPSSRPGETGREWANHKYIDKRKTKSGKTRYIYDNIEAGGQRHRDANDVHAEKAERRRKHAAKTLKATFEGQRNRDRQTTFGNSKLGRAKGQATQAYKNARSSVSNTLDSARSAVSNTASNARKSYDQAVSDGRKWIRDTFGF